MLRYVYSILLVFCCFISKAQFSDSITHYAKFGANGNINRTNSGTAYLFSNEARFSIRNKQTTLNTVAGWVYGEQKDKLTNNDFTTTGDFNLYTQSRNFYYWGLTNYTKSYSLKIRNQLQTGLGIAYNLVNTTNAWLNLSDGLLYETSSLSKRATGENHYQTVRNSFRLAYHFSIGNVVTINGSNFFQNSVNNISDYIIRSNNSVLFKLNKWMSLSTSLTYNQFTRTKAENLLLTYGLTAEKYF